MRLLLSFAPCVLAINDGGFPNDMVGPIRGWRSWNAVFSDVTQAFITRQVAAITMRRLSIDGVPTSLHDVGFTRVGVDSGWASCTGVNNSWHDESGHFIVNTTKFPSMQTMVADGHAKGCKMDFYLNQDLDPGWHSCKSEGSIPGAAANTGNTASYLNDARDAAALGFGELRPSTLFRALFLCPPFRSRSFVFACCLRRDQI